jgi:hypothetical protein
VTDEAEQVEIQVPAPQPVPTVFVGVPLVTPKWRGVQITAYSPVGQAIFFAPIATARNFAKILSEAALKAEQAILPPTGLIVPDVDMSNVLKHLPGNGKGGKA